MPQSISWRLNLEADGPHVYGSRFGWLTLRQSRLDGYRESINIPVVVANVFDFLAGVPGNELYLDMIIRDERNEIVNRKMLRWGANMNESRGLGTFHIIKPEGTQDPVYTLTARITNRTGLRYLFQRYDELPPYQGEGFPSRGLLPAYWRYDLAPYPGADLPLSFQLDPQSQIAPGLVTTYTNIPINMMYSGTGKLFRLYPFVQQPSPLYELTFTHRAVGGMTLYGNGRVSADHGGWAADAFNLRFDNSPFGDFQGAVRQHTGGEPIMLPQGYSFNTRLMNDDYFRAEAFRTNSFTISADVPPELLGVGAGSARRVPVLPMHVRLRISRYDIPEKWNEVIEAENNPSRNLVTELPKICTIQVYSQNTGELYANLFEALRNRSLEADRHENYYMENSIQAFTHNNFLYVDFMVLLADAVSQNVGKTAFIQVVTHDTVNYILIGDGNVDDRWTIGFCVTAAGVMTPPPRRGVNRGMGGGGGCDIWGWGMAFALAALFSRRGLMR